MNTKLRVLLVSFSAIQTGACAVEAEAPMPAPGYRGLIAEALTSDREFIAELAASSTCPDRGPWHGERAFYASPWLEAEAATIPASLLRYCRYIWDGQGDPGTATAMLLQQPDFVSINPIVRSVSVEADPLTAAAAPALRENAEWSYHHVSGADVAGSNASRHPVHLAVIDTEPLGGIQGPSSHGRGMRRLIEKIVCPEGKVGCAVTTLPIVGIPRFPNGTVDFDGGGHVAAPSDPAVGIVEAVSRWRAANASNPTDPSRLVINLSFGVSGGLQSAIGAASENMMVDSLAYARCSGAVVVAAAGNERGHGDSGAAWPAILETVNRPTPSECTTRFGVSSPADPGSYRPLVNAVGALALNGGLSPITIDDSVPRLVAPGTLVPTPAPYETLTGTSVATAEVAGIAALLLSYNPGLSASEVMQLIYDNGSTSGLAEVTAATALSGMPEVRRALACESLQDACSRAGAINSCPALTCTYPFNPPHTVAAISGLLDAVAVEPDHELTATFEDDPTEVYCTALDGEEVLTYGPSKLTRCSESSLRDPLAHLIVPQPGSHGCGTCGFETNTSELTLALDDQYLNPTVAVRAVAITLYDVNKDSVVYELGDLPLDGEKTVVSLEKDLPVFTIAGGTATIYFETGKVTEDELIMN
ncbi:MAG: S8/S53 family peptidase [Nannocystaceae bacterium]|nr:S8/S53 family peptidase [Nannocystaceae bacterium]